MRVGDRIHSLYANWLWHHIEALHDLQGSNDITDILQVLAVLENGIEYTFVEVTCGDGVQYGLQAFGNEDLSFE